MKKRIILFFALLVMCLGAMASQMYTTFIVKGIIMVTTADGTSRPIVMGEELDEGCVIDVPAGCYLTLKSSDKKRHTLTVNQEYRGTIKQIKKIRGAKVKRSSSFMDIIRGKTADYFVNEASRTMSAGGYNTRDIFVTDKQKKALLELQQLLVESDLIDY